MDPRIDLNAHLHFLTLPRNRTLRTTSVRFSSTGGFQIMAGATIRLEGKVAIVGADEHPHAARRLREALPSLDWYSASEGSVPDGVPVMRLRRDAARPEGAFALTVD